MNPAGGLENGRGERDLRLPCVDVAQLVERLVCTQEGSERTLQVRCLSSALILEKDIDKESHISASIAQLGERLIRNQEA